jgi:tRNA-dihydrouridine synthase B
MSGVTDAVFRQLAREKGADVVYTEMVSAEGLLWGDNGSRRLGTTGDAERPVIVQLFGSDPDVLARAAALSQDMGADGIDINMGCPATKVVRQGAGAALLQEPRKIRQILRAVRRAVTVPLSIKLRSGWSAATINAPEMVAIAADCGVDAVALHPRPRSMRFGGIPDWELIAAVKDRAPVPIIGNGDVRSPEDVVRMFRETGCDGVMIGRGSRGDPWIFARSRALIEGEETMPQPGWQEREQLVRRHYRMAADEHDHLRLPRTFLRHLGWYVKGMRRASEFRARIHAVRSTTELEDVMERYFEYLRKREERGHDAEC